MLDPALEPFKNKIKYGHPTITDFAKLRVVSNSSMMILMRDFTVGMEYLRHMSTAFLEGLKHMCTRTLTLTFKNGSTIRVFSLTNLDAIRGYNPNHVFIITEL